MQALQKKIESHRYRKMTDLKDGGLSSLCLCVDTFENRVVVVKTVKSSVFQRFSKDRAQLNDIWESLADERWSSKVLKHKNIAKVYDLIIFKGMPAVVIEFINGQSVEEILEGKQSYNLGARVNIVRQICRGVDFARSRGVYHGDLKPGNIMVAQDWTVKLIDFGSCIILGHSNGVDTRFYTPAYASPEQLNGKTSRVSDIFSTAIIAYELLTGYHPFLGARGHRNLSKKEIIDVMKHSDYRLPPNLGEFPIKLNTWQSVFDKAFAKIPDARFQSADHFFEEFIACFKTTEPHHWHTTENFRAPDDRFEVISELDEIREHQWNQFKESLWRDVKSTEPGAMPKED